MAAADDDSTLKRLRDILKRIRDTAPLLDDDPEGFRQGVADLAHRLQETTGQAGEIELNISTNRISYGEAEVFKSEARTQNLAFDIFRQGLRRLTFKPGLTDDEVHAFVVAFAENRAADQIDEDFVSTLWRESLPNIAYLAIDGFTERIFMSEERFVGAFRGVIDDVMPGLVGFPEDDPGDDGPRPRETIDQGEAVERADLEQRKLRKAMPDASSAVIAQIATDTELAPPTEHVAGLLARLMVKHPSPLADSDLHTVTVRLLAAWLEHSEWQRFADAVRSYRALIDAADRFAAPVAARLTALRETIAGRDLVEHLAHHTEPENTDFTAWARWHFATSAALSAPDLLELIDACQNPAGVVFLKDLLRRQGTESLDPWAERLRDPNPGVVLEVIEVIVGSDLSEQARPLLMETMKHPSAEVRAAAAEGLAGAYDLAVREALLPFLKDPDAVVRRAVVTRFLAAGDRSVSPYLASTIRADIFPGFEEDEQRLYFETLARLGGARFLDVFEHALGLGDDSGGGLGRFFKRQSNALIDTPTRRGAISGLGILGSREALALIRRVHARADLGLAAHCDVVLRLAARGEAAGEAPADIAPQRAAPLEDVGVGETRMGDRVLFDASALTTPAPAAPRPDPAAARALEAAHPAEPAPSGAPRPPSEAPSLAKTPAPSKPAEPPPLELGARPLLRPGERYLATDVVRLEVDGDLTGGALRLESVEAALVGAPIATRPREPRRMQTPVRIVEKRAAPAAAEFTHAPEAGLEDILRSYLGVDADDPAPAVEPAQTPMSAAEPAHGPSPAGVPSFGAGLPHASAETQDAMRALLDFDAPTHHEIKSAAASPTPAPPAEPELEPEPTMVPPSGGNASEDSVEALLKGFLALEAEAPSEPSIEVAPDDEIEELDAEDIEPEDIEPEDIEPEDIEPEAMGPEAIGPEDTPSMPSRPPPMPSRPPPMPPSATTDQPAARRRTSAHSSAPPSALQRIGSRPPGERPFTLPPADDASFDPPSRGDEAGFWRAVPASEAAPADAEASEPAASEPAASEPAASEPAPDKSREVEDLLRDFLAFDPEEP